MQRVDPRRSSLTPLPRPAPYAAVEAGLAGTGEERLVLTLAGEGLSLSAVYAAGSCWLEVDGPAGPSVLRSRRSGRAGPVAALGLALTGTHVTVLSREVPDGPWTGRARVDLADTQPRAAALVREPDWLDRLQVAHEGPATSLLAGGFGQLGLRDIRVVTHADGTAYDAGDGRVRLSATSAGPGPFGTGHASVWALDPGSLALEQTADLFFHRPGERSVHGDHAVHVVRDGGEWLVATSTWGDLDPDRDGARVDVLLASPEAAAGADAGTDVLRGVHVLRTELLRLPTDGLVSVGVWDPHLVRTDTGWLVGYVSASRFFRFHPVLAEGPDLRSLQLRAAALGRTATEGPTLLLRPDLPGGVVVLASDGPDGPRGAREQWVVLDTDLREVARLDGDFPTNIPWPTLVRDDRDGASGWLLVTFDGTPHGGRVCGYGTHGDVVVLRGTTDAH